MKCQLHGKQLPRRLLPPLCEEQVIDIYIRYGKGESCDILAKEFNISKGMAYHIGAGNKWYSVTDLIEDDYFDNYTPLKERTA